MLLEKLESDDGLGHSLRSNLKTAEERLETQTTARSGAWALLDDAKALAAAADLPGALRIYSNIGEPPTLLALRDITEIAHGLLLLTPAMVPAVPADLELTNDASLTAACEQGIEAVQATMREETMSAAATLLAEAEQVSCNRSARLLLGAQIWAARFLLGNRR